MSAVDGVGSGLQARPGRRRPRGVWVAVGLVLLVLCSGQVAVLVWFVKGTADASRGGGSPAVAVIGVMGGVDQWADQDLGDELRFMSSEHQAQLRARLQQLRGQLVNR